MTRLRVGIMGAGRMASDYDGPNDTVARTWANAVRQSADCELGGFYDVAPGRAEAAERKWGCSSTPRDRAAWLESGWDLIVIATPPAAHAADLRDCLTHRPRGIVLEKPVAEQPRDGVQMLEEARSHDVALLVNYPRRFNIGTGAVRRLVHEGALGQPRDVHVTVSGSIATNGVHALDLFYGWWPAHYTVTLGGRAAATTLLELRSDDGVVAASLTESPIENCFVWEIVVHCSHGEIRLGGRPEQLDVLRPDADAIVPGVTSLHCDASFDMEYEPVLSHALNHLVMMTGDSTCARGHLSSEIDVQAFIADVGDAMAGAAV